MAKNKLEYRIWIKKINGIRHKKMYPICDYNGGLHILPNGELYCSSDPIPFLNSDFVVMRKTSWVDKNKTPIYEGDILKIKIENTFERILVCKYGKFQKNIIAIDGEKHVAEMEGFYFLAKDIFKYLVPLIKNGIADTEKMKIIGNIYENPELMEI